MAVMGYFKRNGELVKGFLGLPGPQKWHNFKDSEFLPKYRTYSFYSKNMNLVIYVVYCIFN